MDPLGDAGAGVAALEVELADEQVAQGVQRREDS